MLTDLSDSHILSSEVSSTELWPALILPKVRVTTTLNHVLSSVTSTTLAAKVPNWNKNLSLLGTITVQWGHLKGYRRQNQRSMRTEGIQPAQKVLSDVAELSMHGRSFLVWTLCRGWHLSPKQVNVLLSHQSSSSACQQISTPTSFQKPLHSSNAPLLCPPTHSIFLSITL